MTILLKITTKRNYYARLNLVYSAARYETIIIGGGGGEVKVWRWIAGGISPWLHEPIHLMSVFTLTLFGGRGIYAGGNRNNSDVASAIFL
jgi:hypothetical protein